MTARKPVGLPRPLRWFDPVQLRAYASAGRNSKVSPEPLRAAFIRLVCHLRAFDEIEETLDQSGVEAFAQPSNDPENQIKTLGHARRRVGRLQRTLAPHREVFAALSHSEFGPLSSEASAERFVALTARVDAALASARDVKDGIASSFDVLIVRTEHRTNEIMKVLTLASILLLPSALLAGVAGMNVNFDPHTFVHSPLFWAVVTAIILIALSPSHGYDAGSDGHPVARSMA